MNISKEILKEIKMRSRTFTWNIPKLGSYSKQTIVMLNKLDYKYDEKTGEIIIL